MRCILCKSLSDSSKSVEHIVPASLGNEDHVLPPGWVCDACNNYLSREVEAPFLNSEYGKRARFEMRIPSRRGRIPVVGAFHPQSRSEVNLLHDDDGLSVFAARYEDEARFINVLRTQTHGSLYVPVSGAPSPSYETARFISKIGLEVLAYRCLGVDGWNEELANKSELDELRDYVRRGKPGFIWPVCMRRIYPADHRFSDAIDSAFQVLHEWDILFIPSAEASDMGECYAVIAILGVEFAINLGGPELEGYSQWLAENENRSFLYQKSEAEHDAAQDGESAGAPSPPVS